MKRIYFAIAIMLLSFNSQAQYKKASFLNKSGRTYGIGTSLRFMGGGGGAIPGFYYSFGRDKGKRIFHWFDIEVLLPIKYQYKTFDTNEPSKQLTVSGKSSASMAYRYNFAYYLKDIENSDSKFKPFATVGINGAVFLGTANGYTVSPTTYYYIDKTPVTDAMLFGVNGGLGGIYDLSKKIGVKFTGGYNVEVQYVATDYSSGSSNYKVYASHPYLTVGLRLLINGDGD